MKTTRRFWNPDEVPEVDEQPREPRDQTAQAHASDVGDCRAASDRRKVALVVVAERLGVPAAQPSAYRVGRVAALLHRDRRHSGQDAGHAIGVAHAHHVAEREYLRVAGKREVGADGHSPATVEFRPAAFG